MRATVRIITDFSAVISMLETVHEALNSKLDLDGPAEALAQRLLNEPKSFIKLRSVNFDDVATGGARDLRVVAEPTDLLIELMAAVGAGDVNAGVK